MNPNEVPLLAAVFVVITIIGTVVGITESEKRASTIKGRILFTLAFATLPSIALTMATIFAANLIKIIGVFI